MSLLYALCAICRDGTPGTVPIGTGNGGLHWLCSGCGGERPEELLALGAAIAQTEEVAT